MSSEPTNPSVPRGQWRIIVGCAILALVVLVASQFICVTAFLSYGILVSHCPEGTPRQTVSVSCGGLRRGSPGVVLVEALAHYTTGRADRAMTTQVRRFSTRVTLVNASGEETPLQPKEGWKEEGHRQTGEITLPEVRDGEYRLRTWVDSPLGKSQFDLALPIYAPARIHVITDRPLYQPGNVVLFRAVALRAKDLAPLDGRPGEWFVENPEGEAVLEEKSPAKEWGVATGSFPLDANADPGDWKVRWSSGGASDEVKFRVEPFTLPRFRIEVSTPRSFYLPGDRPTVKGRVVYSSGAPVANAGLTLQWSVSGDWPPPTSWMAGGLPQSASADRNGRFELQLPVIPSDLQDQATLAARISATDSAGDRVEGAASVLLSHDSIQATAVTELADGLVAGFNNRLYLRVTTASGEVLAKAPLVVRRAWDPRDKGIETTTDEDGVTAVQVDPGPPVNVVIPPQPVRPQPRPSPITRLSAENLIDRKRAPLADSRAMDEWNRILEPCSRFVESGPESVTVAVAVDPAGVVTNVAPHDTAIASCLTDAIRGRRIPAGAERLYSVTYSLVPDSARPSLEAEVSGAPAVLDDLSEVVKEAALDARSCLPNSVPDGELSELAIWQVHSGRKEITASWKRGGGKESLPQVSMACIEKRFASLKLGEEPPADSLGVVHLQTHPSESQRVERPQATTMLGYELKVTARPNSKEAATTKLRIRPGAVPNVRLRATPIYANPGESVEVAVIRGPNFNEEFPKELTMSTDREPIKAELDKLTHRALFKLPAELQGWVSVSWGGAQAIAYIRPRAELAVHVNPEHEHYAPGQTARLEVLTSAGGTGTRAAVSLLGVDQSLGQLVPLPGASDMARLRPQPTMTSSAFGVLDGEALALGRIRGVNAAAATILRVGSLPAPAETDVAISESGAGVFDPVEDLTDHFYTVLSELHSQVEAWEEQAPKGAKMDPKKMSELWKSAIGACEKRKEGVTDSYGRPLRLSQLPPDLLSLTDPRTVVTDGTRLPEDVDNWMAWVQKEKP
jgi:hypothetical protein